MAIPAIEVGFLPRRHPWWREGEILVLTALVLAAYFLRADALPLRGEESRRATIAREMIRGGDWVVPRQQGEPFLSRPPLGNWLIAGASLLRGQCDPWAVRLPTLMAVLLTTLLAYAYGRRFLGRLGAFAAALGFATMGEVMQLGRQAECDTVFTFLLGGALLVWHWGYAAGWPGTLTWVLGYGLAALAALQKGPQAPVYFIGSVVVYLALRRDWRRLLGGRHLLGLVVFAAIIAAWQVPFTRQLGWAATRKIWLGDTEARFQELTFTTVAGHLVTYPLEILGCTAPWSLFLVAYLSRRFRRSLGAARPSVQFLATSAVIGFLPCWASPSGMTRYYMPLYPSVTLLAGTVVQQATETAFSRRLRTVWAGAWRVLAGAWVAVAAAVLLIAVMAVHPVVAPFAEPVPLAVAYAAVAVVAAGLIGWGGRSAGRRPLRLAVLSLAVMMAGSFAGVAVDGMLRRSEDPAAAVARLKARLPADAHLVSFCPVHHLFAYYFDEPIELRGWPGPAGDGDRDVTWFCYQAIYGVPLPVPFAWEEVAVIPMDRFRQPKPHNVVVVGRRLPAQGGG